MRKFVLFNEKDEFITLTGPVFHLINPEGLGTAFGPKIVRLDNGFHKKVKSFDVDSSTINGTLLFYHPDDSREEYIYYNAFLNFVSRAEKLVLGYAPYNSDNPDELFLKLKDREVTKLYELDRKDFTEISDVIINKAYETMSNTLEGLFRIDVDLATIEKAEINSQGVLASSVQFNTKSPWYSKWTMKDIRSQASSVMTEDFELPSLSGHLDAGLEVKISNAVMRNLTIEVLSKDINDNNQEIWTSCGKAILSSIPNTVTSGILFSSMADDHRIIGNPGTDNEIQLIDYVDITSDPFIKIPTNMPELKLRLSSTSVSFAFNMSVDICIKDYYRGV